jgi:deazaflavin-dependent oxidoreductase (nitroreductase family)
MCVLYSLSESKIEERRDTFMAKTYQVNFATRTRDALLMTLQRAGVNMGTMSLLTVRGRTSGQPHTVPVLLVEQDGQRWLVAPYGVVQWVRNIRAAGTATLTRGRHSEAISVTELPAQEAAPILKQYLLNGARVGPYFDATKDSPLEAFEREAPHHPVFQITPVKSPQKERMQEAL